VIPAVYPETIQSEQLCSRRKAGMISLFDLASGGVCPAGNVTISAVGSYPAFSPLPRHSSEIFGKLCRGSLFSVVLSVF